MGGEEKEGRQGVTGAVKRSVSRLLEVVRTRVDLFATELQLEKVRLLELLFLTTLVAGLVLMAVIAISLALVLSVREELRIATLCGLSVVFLAGAGALLLGIRKRLHGREPFRHTLDEFKKDKSCLEDPKS